MNSGTMWRPGPRPRSSIRGLNDDEQKLLAELPEATGKNLLLLGVGGGREAIPLAGMGFRVTGVDYAAAMVERGSGECGTPRSADRWAGARDLPTGCAGKCI